MKAENKCEVLNSLTLFNTVGAELVEIFEAHGIHNYEDLLKVKNLEKKETLSPSLRDKAAKIVKSDSLQGFLERFENNYLKKRAECNEAHKKAKENFRKLKGVLPLLNDEFTEGFDVLDDITDFFGAENDEDIFVKLKTANKALFRENSKTKINEINLYGWLRRGELDFAKLEKHPYDKSRLAQWVDSGVWKLHLEDTKYFLELPQMFDNWGVGLVFVPYLPNTVYGAVRWMDGNPLIQISDRGKDLATCWFTLFHEIGHVLKHENIDVYEEDLNSDKTEKNRMEKDANKFANEYLFNGDDLRKEVFACKKAGTYVTAKELASKYNVHHMFASYWLRKAQHYAEFQTFVTINFADMYQ
jgi:hypothetical protein